MADPVQTPDVPPIPSFSQVISSLGLHKYKVIAIVVATLAIVIGGVIFVNDYLDTKAALRQQIAISSTNSEMMKKIGDALVAQGHVVDNVKTLQQQTVDVMGKQLADYMANNNATIRAIYTAIGRVESEVKVGAATVTPGKDGGFTDVKLTQARTGPPMAEVGLAYNPTATDPTKRLIPTWTNYREDFFPSLGEWQKKDKGYTAAFQLHRDIYRPDPTAKDGYVKVGTEVINLKDATANYNQDNFATGNQVEVPRWNVILGAGRNFNQKQTVPVGIVGYRFTNTLGMHGGAVGSTFLVGGSYHFNFK